MAETSLPASDPADDAPDLTGRTLGEFRVLRLLGGGGMGRVYLAEQASLKRHVALKVLRPDLAANPVTLKRFRAEAEAVARITHANIVQVYAIGEADGVHFMALEYVEGRNLRDYLLKKGPPELPIALSVMRQVAAALQRASELGFVHRDVKPENILLTRKGEVKVADFGLSRCLTDDRPLNLTASGVTMGTPLYMSPEQVQGQPLDPRSDIYSLGVTCYHMLAGRPPFRGQSAFEVAVQHVQTEPTPLVELRPDLPAELIALVGRMMAKDPAARPQTCREILKELNRLRDALAPGSSGLGVSGGLSLPSGSVPSLPPVPGAAPSASTPAVATAPTKRHGWLGITATLVLALAAGAGTRVYRAAATGEPSSPGSSAWEELPRVPSQEEKELLRETERKLPGPNARPWEVARALDPRIKLGLLYLREGRLQEAEDYFKKQSVAMPIGPFRTLGDIGLAVVRAYRDRPQESNDQFLALLADVRSLPPDRGGKAGHPMALLWNHFELRECVADALERNARNLAPQKMPERLNALRQPPAVRAK